MNREEYLKRLSFLLKDLPEEEIEDAIAYYEDYFEEAGEEKEEQVIKELGSPEKIATMLPVLWYKVPSGQNDCSGFSGAHQWFCSDSSQ